MRTFIAAFVVAFSAFGVPYALSYLAPALRTGVLQARGRVYERTAQPIRFWLGVCFWSFIIAFSLLLFFSMLHFEFGLLR